MANKLHTEWLGCKKVLEDQIQEYKNGRSNQIPTVLEDALKSFNKGFGPKLEEVGKAYKAKNDAEIKKQAGKALDIALVYDKTLSAKPTAANQMAFERAKKQLQPVIHALTDLKNTGSKAANPF